MNDQLSEFDIVFRCLTGRPGWPDVCGRAKRLGKYSGLWNGKPDRGCDRLKCNMLQIEVGQTDKQED